MAGKGKKKGGKGKKQAAAGEEAGEENGEEAPKKGKGKGKKGGKGGKSSKFQGDLFSESAMENAYYVCHNVQVSNKIFIIESNLVEKFSGCSKSKRICLA